MVIPECGEVVRSGPGGRVGLSPGLVQRGNPPRYRLERARGLRLTLTGAPVRVGRLECSSVTLMVLMLMMLMLRWRARPLVPLFEREFVPVRDEGRDRRTMRS
ncbi:hypothetical protein EYF80_053626 [Liparis tanakae]|uniref:Uncharacterized protein n=1 Tax=Liparis tanakae TaxID=230148 RepID=A0A4Z2F5U8_9TELE|nr:hypothetical protein EYF80_053626 [Liparis tanakae]